ncbi:hypothetical protein CPB85DRAFT_659536 [Mucidula mucida]|nr:hypothetical protein CPB85DRAFT_659536 [Mucidula mucida]
MATQTPLFPSFLMLPFELSDKIFGELQKTDLQQLRLASRALSKSRSIQEKLFYTLYIPLYSYKPQTHVLSLLSFCAAVKSGSTDLASFVRCLQIQGEHYWNSDIGSVARAKRNLKALFSVQRRLVKALFEMRPYLNRVTILRLSYVSQPNMINRLLMDSLTSMTSISEVTMFSGDDVFCTEDEPRFPSGFRDLERLTINAVLNKAELVSVLQHSGRTLTHLHCTRVDELQLADVPQLGRGIPLRYISTNYDFPASVWQAFSRAGIHLEHISVSHAIQRADLLEYLDSYSGLCSLSIQVASADWSPSEALQNSS